MPRNRPLGIPWNTECESVTERGAALFERYNTVHSSPLHWTTTNRSSEINSHSWGEFAKNKVCLVVPAAVKIYLLQ